MKKSLSLLCLALVTITTYSQEDNRPVNTGDDFSLEGALAMFKKAGSIEEFEKLLNEENNNVNNLDLNNDDEIDYIMVEDIKEGDSHLIVLSTYLNETEKQDIATISVEKTGEDQAALQIEGDKDLYPENTFIEPTEVTETIKNSKGPNTPEIDFQVVTVNVWLWPTVRFLYGPRYVVWVSPYRWRNYPRWWKPWRPLSHPVFFAHCAPHRVYYRPVTVRRVVVARSVYTPRRHSSTLVVHNRRGTTVVHKNKRGNVKAVKIRRNPARVRVRR